MNSKEYRQSLQVKIKDMTAEQKKKYNNLRNQESRAKKKAKPAEEPKKIKFKVKAKPAEEPKKIKFKVKAKPAEPKKVMMKVKNVPNKDLKCFMLSTNGRPYRTCVKKDNKEQVRRNPRPAKFRKKPYVVAYKDAGERKANAREQAKAKRALKKAKPAEEPKKIKFKVKAKPAEEPKKKKIKFVIKK